MRSLLSCLAVLVCAAAPARAQAQAQRPTLTVVNRSGQGIEELYVSSTRMSDWGSDRLGNATIANGRTFRLRLTEGCLYDLQVVYADGRTEERMRSNLCRTPTQTFTAAEAHAPPAEPSHSFTLENRTTRSITEVATAPPGSSGQPTWSDNITDAPILPAARQELTFRGDCQADVRIVFDNGSAEQRRRVNLCAEPPELTVAPGWTTLDEVAPPPTADPVAIENRSTHRIVELFLFPNGAPHGDDQLGAGVLEPGAERQIALDRDGACRFTLRAVFEGDVPDQEQTDLDFCPRRRVTVEDR